MGGRRGGGEAGGGGGGGGRQGGIGGGGVIGRSLCRWAGSRSNYCMQPGRFGDDSTCRGDGVRSGEDLTSDLLTMILATKQ